MIALKLEPRDTSCEHDEDASTVAPSGDIYALTGSFRFTSSDPAWILEALARSPLDARRDLRRAPDSAQTENHEDGESGIVGGTTGVVGRRIVSIV